MDADDADARLAELERRVRRIEDEREVERTLVAYGFAVDAGDAGATAALYTAGSRTTIDDAVVLEGSAAIHAMVLGPEHQAIIPGSAHVMGPFRVEVDGDRARAVGYATTYVRDGDDVRVWRQAVNRWELDRQGDGWAISRRESRQLSSPAASAVLRDGLPPAP